MLPPSWEQFLDLNFLSLLSPLRKKCAVEGRVVEVTCLGQKLRHHPFMLFGGGHWLLDLLDQGRAVLAGPCCSCHIWMSGREMDGGFTIGPQMPHCEQSTRRGH